MRFSPGDTGTEEEATHVMFSVPLLLEAAVLGLDEAGEGGGRALQEYFRLAERVPDVAEGGGGGRAKVALRGGPRQVGLRDHSAQVPQVAVGQALIGFHI